MGRFTVKFILLLLALQGPSAVRSEVSELPTQLVLKVDGLSKREVAVGQEYASCVSTPWLPTAYQFKKKAEACTKSKGTRSSKLKKVMRWVGHIAVQFPGQEINLQIRRK